MMHRFLLFALCLILLCPAAVFAGQGPQNVAVVINTRSALSLEVGHHYASLRNVPTSNLIYLEWEGSPVSTDVESFRQQILLPLAKQLEERRIGGHITTIAYSADFPYVIDFKADLRDGARIDPTARQFHQGSLTGLTYLAQWVLAKDVERYTNLSSNRYYRPSLDGKLLAETRSFPPGVAWDAQGEPTTGAGARYLMSTMLAYTSGRGNSRSEVQRYLDEAWRADGTYPAGKIYFLTNGDIRARTREPGFKAAKSLLESMGVAAEIVEGVLPKERSDIMGAMLGSVDYRFADSDSTVRAGAICENLTSFGGVLRDRGGQTALTECLRAGAAGSSGTVTEPFAIQAKFPHPLLHVHYARGSSLAEAFYQSVQGPYQLLVVGDPLCRPWATIPQVSVSGLPAAGQKVRGRLLLSPQATTVTGKGVERFELYVDGRLHSQAKAAAAIEVDTSEWPDGYHELRVVAYEDSLITTQGEAVVGIESENHEVPLPTLAIDRGARARLDEELAISASAPGATSLVLLYNQRPVATVESDRASWTLSASHLGLGKGAFQLLARSGPDAKNAYLSAPHAMHIQPAATLPAAVDSPSTKPGLRLKRTARDAVVIEQLEGDWLRKAEIMPKETFTLDGVFQVENDELAQFQFEFSGELKVVIDGRSLGSFRRAKPAFVYLPAALSAGMHRIEIEATCDEALRLNGWFGHQGTQAVTQERFRHVE